MKKLRLQICLMVVVFVAICSLTSCKKDDAETDFSKLLIGTWISDSVEGTSNVTNDKFVTIYRPDYTNIYAEGYNADSSYWNEENTIYAVLGSQLTINIENIFGKSSYYVIDMQYIDDNTIKFTDKQFIKNGVDQDSSVLSTYIMRRAQLDYSKEIRGLWKGHETTVGSAYEHDFYWNFEDGTYSFYYYSDNSGLYIHTYNDNYYLYGNLLSCNYKNFSGYAGETGKYVYDNWMISIKNDTMYWNDYKNGSVEHSFMMVRANNPPVK